MCEFSACIPVHLWLYIMKMIHINISLILDLLYHVLYPKTIEMCPVAYSDYLNTVCV